MRRLHSDSPFRHALSALQDADGYVEALFSMARESARRPPVSFSRGPDRRSERPRGRAVAH